MSVQSWPASALEPKARGIGPFILDSLERLEASSPLWAHETPCELLHRAFFIPGVNREEKRVKSNGEPLLLTIPANEPWRLRIVVWDENDGGVNSWSAQVRLPVNTIRELEECSRNWPTVDETPTAVWEAFWKFEGLLLMGVEMSNDQPRVVFAHSKTRQQEQALDYFVRLLREAKERLPDSWVRDNVVRALSMLLETDSPHRP